MNESSYLGRVLEGFLFFCILLVLIHTFGEEYAVFRDYSVTIRRYLLISSFAFDLLFSIEFIARMIVSGRRKGLGRYLTVESGIIDFVSSLPLLLLNSGPLLFMTFFTSDMSVFILIGGVSFLKIIKIMRLVRVLRFIRTLKFFGKVRNKYAMTPKYIAAVLTITITASVVSLVSFNYLEQGRIIISESAQVERLLSNPEHRESDEKISYFASTTDAVIFVKRNGNTVYRSMSDYLFNKHFMQDDYYTSKFDDYEVYFSTKDVQKVHAFINLLVFSLIILTIIGTVTLFRRYFNRHISSVVNVMTKGFTKEGYSTLVRIKRDKTEFEIYRLADQYNRKWLPIKRRIIELRRKRY